MSHPRSRAALPLLIIVAALVLIGVGLDAALVAAADPEATLVPAVLTGDPRSDGGGPGIVGSPLAVLLGVVALGCATVLVTAVLVRLAQRR